MNAIVDVYLDNNLGDNIMGETLLHYLETRNIKCYLLATDEFTYADILAKYPNVCLITNLKKETLREHNIHFYIKIGGSMFPHNSIKEGVLRFLTLFQYMQLKRNGVKIFILGCNVGPFSSSIGVYATKKIIKMANLITCRDKETFNFISKIKSKDYYLYPDVVFNRKDLKIGKQEKGVLGISTYTGYTSNLKKSNLPYSKIMINIINKYIEASPLNKVKLFVFDTGYNSDYPTTYKIYHNVDCKDKVEVVAFDGNIYSFMQEFNKCSYMIGTRFHSIILSLFCKIPVLPVVYSNKSRNILSDLNYQGIKLDISNLININVENIVKSINIKENLLYDFDQDIMQKAEGHFVVLGKYLDSVQLSSQRRF